MLRMLVTLALRHYRDPTSWIGLIVAVAAASHWTVDPELANSLASFAAAAVGLIFTVCIDGRRLQPSGDPPESSDPEKPVLPAGAGTAVRPAPTEPVRRIGPDHGP
jgi:hypothetical protein